MQSNISVAFSCVQVQSLPYLPSKLACDFRNTQIQEKKTRVSLFLLCYLTRTPIIPTKLMFS